MQIRFWLSGVLALALLAPACSSSDKGEESTPPPEEAGPNPFLGDLSNKGKEDTGYMNPDGIEVEVDIEADVEAPTYRLADGPAHVGQFALTYLRKRGQFYLESLAEDSSSKERVEWLVDGSWITAADAASVPQDSLRHFRIRGINAVLLHDAASGVSEGTVFQAPVPIDPFNVMSAVGDKCADYNSHITLGQSVYWYLWNPDKAECELPTQQLQITVSKMFAERPTTYPEYDKLVEDGKVTAVVMFGQIGDELNEWDSGVRGHKRMADWLLNAEFTEVTPAPVGRRFTKHIGSVDYEIDLYSPYDFAGLSDHAHYANFEKAIQEHEIVTYDGHSMMGSSDFWGRPQYPQFYQIFLYGGCLGYEYYVTPILGGKGGWENLDIMASVIEVSADANRFAGPFLAKMMWALDHGYGASWKDMLIAVRESVGDSTFGANGVRDNCFSPGGSLCGPPVDPGTTVTHEDAEAADIPDNDASGLSKVIQVPDSFTATGVTLELDITHTWIGDLTITLSHGGTEAVVWEQTGGSGDNIQQSFTLTQFVGQDVSGDWTLRVEDTASQDVGKLNRWAVVLAQ